MTHRITLLRTLCGFCSVYILRSETICPLVESCHRVELSLAEPRRTYSGFDQLDRRSGGSKYRVLGAHLV